MIQYSYLSFGSEGRIDRFSMEKGAVYVEALEGGAVGPVMLNKELLKLLKIGDVMWENRNRYLGSFFLIAS